MSLNIQFIDFHGMCKLCNISISASNTTQVVCIDLDGVSVFYEYKNRMDLLANRNTIISENGIIEQLQSHTIRSPLKEKKMVERRARKANDSKQSQMK